MNKVVLKLLSLLLLLCFTATIVPVKQFHEHENEHTAEHSCRSIQLNTDKEYVTSHETHEHCELCEILSTYRFDLASNETNQNKTSSVSTLLFSRYTSITNVLFSEEYSGRGPPQLI